VPLNRNSGVPLYVQIRELLRLGLAQGTWDVGEAIPSEEELCARFRVSRGTVRQALQELVREGLLVRSRRLGTRVVQRPSQSGLLLVSPFRAIQTAGLHPRVQVLALEKRPTPRRVRAAWSSGTRTRPARSAVYFDRVFWADGEPVARGSSWVPAPRFERLLDLDLTRRAFLDVLAREFGVVITRIDERMELTAMTAENARLLLSRKGAPCLAVTLCQWSRGEPVEYAEFWLDPAKSHYLLTGLWTVSATLPPVRGDTQHAAGHFRP
jgi:GntR family transcriptional regulator